MNGGLWNEDEGFYCDAIRFADESVKHLKVCICMIYRKQQGVSFIYFLQIHSFVGLIPLFAVEILEEATLKKLPSFSARFEWVVKYRPHLVQNIASFTTPGVKYVANHFSISKLTRI